MVRKGCGKRRSQKKGEESRKQTEDSGYPEWIYEHAIFEAYYKMQFESYFKEDINEFTQFWNMMKEKLPVVFRINKQTPNYSVFLNNMKDEQFINTFIQLKRDAIAVDKKGQEEDKQDTSGENQEENKEEESLVGHRIKRFEFSQEEIEKLEIKKMDFYPDELVWQINCNRAQLKKSHLLKDFHRYLQRANSSGLISRQELVSMLPPLLLDVQSDDIVFDMCAAPGSKTAQLLELMWREETGGGGMQTKGSVVANDVDQKRAHLLTHQVCRINPSGLVVINHPAQFFPRLDDPLTGKPFYFDKVSADVPCSGDGATRKIPTQWRDWTTRDAQVLHPLQIAILQRAITLCKVGGYVVYSTCSLNPIEDEAVVSEVFRRAPLESLELINVHTRLPGLKGREGLSHWKVCSSTTKHPGYVIILNKEGWFLIECCRKKDKNTTDTVSDWLKMYDTFEEVDKTQKCAQFVRSSMFPQHIDTMVKNIQIQNTMRILPHDSDTGGFYLALIQKKALFVWEKKQTHHQTGQGEDNDNNNDDVDDDDMPDASEIPEEAQNLQNIDQEEGVDTVIVDVVESDKQTIEKENFVQIYNEDWQNIQESYGIEGIDQSLFIVSTVGKQKTVKLVTEGAKRFNDCDTKGMVNILNMGTKAFERSREHAQDLQCRFRICQDSVNLLAPYITKRKINITADDFKFFISNKNAKFVDFPNQSLKEEISQFGQGSIVLHCLEFNDNIVCQNFQISVNIMTNKEITESLKIRYLQQLF